MGHRVLCKERKEEFHLRTVPGRVSKRCCHWQISLQGQRTRARKQLTLTLRVLHRSQALGILVFFLAGADEVEAAGVGACWLWGLAEEAWFPGDEYCPDCALMCCDWGGDWWPC